MGWVNRKTPWEKEWDLLCRREASFLKRQSAKPESLLNRKLEEVVPENLQGKLDLAFGKAFQLVFEKGTGVIEKTYAKEKQEDAYKVREFTLGLRQNRKNLKSFSRQAGRNRAKNLVVSGVEGVGLGLFGIGIPDIPLFTGMILKSVYETAISYGFSYDTHGERLFILKLIRGSMEHGENLSILNDEIDGMIAGDIAWEGVHKEEIQKTARILSRELLYMKFLQGLPVAGVVGGLSDAVALKKITDYAAIKYQKRLLLKHKKQ